MPGTESDVEHRRASLLPTFLGVAVALLVCATVLIIGLARRSTGGVSVPSDYTVVHLEEFTYGFRLPTTKLPAGNTLFVDLNQGSIPHEFVLFKTALSAAKLPIGSDGDVVEDSKELENVIDSGSDIPPGNTRLLAVPLEPGHYVLVCNLPGHYKSGMRLDVTVT